MEALKVYQLNNIIDIIGHVNSKGELKEDDKIVLFLNNENNSKDVIIMPNSEYPKDSGTYNNRRVLGAGEFDKEFSYNSKPVILSYTNFLVINGTIIEDDFKYETDSDLYIVGYYTDRFKLQKGDVICHLDYSDKTVYLPEIKYEKRRWREFEPNDTFFQKYILKDFSGKEDDISFDIRGTSENNYHFNDLSMTFYANYEETLLNVIVKDINKDFLCIVEHDVVSGKMRAMSISTNKNENSLDSLESLSTNQSIWDGIDLTFDVDAEVVIANTIEKGGWSNLDKLKSNIEYAMYIAIDEYIGDLAYNIAESIRYVFRDELEADDQDLIDHNISKYDDDGYITDEAMNFLYEKHIKESPFVGEKYSCKDVFSSKFQKNLEQDISSMIEKMLPADVYSIEIKEIE